MIPHVTSCVEEMRRTLLATRNADGGWGYAAGRVSRLEPTCWAVLALATEADAGPFLSALPRHSDLFAEPASEDGGVIHPVNIAFNGLAAVLLAQHPSLLPPAVRAAQLRALAADHRPATRRFAWSANQTALRAWPWIAGASSWIEPTAWCLLALRRTSEPAIAVRLEQAIDLLRDQTCAAGGWNYGSARLLGRELPPQIPTTALVLLALQDRRHEPYVSRSFAYLRAHQLDERSGAALALVAIAFGILHEDAATVRWALLGQWIRTRYLGSLSATAMALFALTADDHALDAFRF